MSKSMIRFCQFLILLLVISWATVAHAAEVQSEALTRVGNDLVEIVAKALGVVVLCLIAIVARKVKQRYDVELPNTWMAQIETWIDRGIAYAEEQGHKAVKYADDKIGARVPDKLDIAATFVLDSVNDRELTRRGKEWVKQAIEARLNTTRFDEKLGAYRVVPGSDL